MRLSGPKPGRLDRSNPGPRGGRRPKEGPVVESQVVLAVVFEDGMVVRSFGSPDKNPSESLLPAVLRAGKLRALARFPECPVRAATWYPLAEARMGARS